MQWINSVTGQSGDPIRIAFKLIPPFWRAPWFLVLSALVIFGIGFIIVYTVDKRIRAKRDIQARILELRKQALNARMNPHFIFNSINSIQAIVIDEDTETAYRYLERFSALFRLTLTQSGKEQVTLEEEVKTLTLYLELEKLRFKQKFAYKLHAPSSQEDQQMELPTMMVQPFVENALVHGLLPLRKDSFLEIFFLPSAEFLEVRIKDNGIGRKAAGAGKTTQQHVSMATGLVEQRIAIMRKKFGPQVNMTIHDLTNEAGEPLGTEVILRLPILNV